MISSTWTSALRCRGFMKPAHRVVIARPFLAPLLWGVILAIATWPAFAWCRQHLGGRNTLAAALMTLLLAVVLLGPLAVIGAAMTENVAALGDRLRAAIQGGLASNEAFAHGRGCRRQIDNRVYGPVGSRLAPVQRRFFRSQQTETVDRRLNPGLLSMTVLAMENQYLLYSTATSAVP